MVGGMPPVQGQFPAAVLPPIVMKERKFVTTQTPVSI